MEIVAVPAFADNYLWLVHDPASGETAVVDPGDAAPVLTAANARGWTHRPGLEHALAPDHTGGNLAIKAATGARISGPRKREYPRARHSVERRRRGPPRQPRRPRDRSSRPHARPYRFDVRRRADRASSATRCSRWAAGVCSRARRNRCTHRSTGWPRCPKTPSYTARTNIRCRTRASPATPNPAMRQSPSGLRRSRRCGARTNHPADERRAGACNQSLRSRVELGGVRAPAGRRKTAFVELTEALRLRGRAKVNLKEVEMRVSLSLSLSAALASCTMAPPPPVPRCRQSSANMSSS